MTPEEFPGLAARGTSRWPVPAAEETRERTTSSLLRFARRNGPVEARTLRGGCASGHRKKLWSEVFPSGVVLVRDSSVAGMLVLSPKKAVSFGIKFVIVILKNFGMH